MPQPNPYPLRVDRTLLEKFKVIAKAHGRSVNKELEMMIKSSVIQYEDLHGMIEIPGLGLVKTVSSPIRLLLQLLLQLSGEADCRLCSLHRGHLLSRDTIRRGLYAYGISIYPIFLFVKPRIILAGYFLLDCACPACYNLRYKEVRKWLILKK